MRNPEPATSQNHPAEAAKEIPFVIQLKCRNSIISAPIGLNHTIQWETQKSAALAQTGLDWTAKYQQQGGAKLK